MASCFAPTTTGLLVLMWAGAVVVGHTVHSYHIWPTHSEYCLPARVAVSSLETTHTNCRVPFHFNFRDYGNCFCFFLLSSATDLSDFVLDISRSANFSPVASPR